MQCVFLFLASLVIPVVRDHTLHICQGCTPARRWVSEAVQEHGSPLSLEPHPSSLRSPRDPGSPSWDGFLYAQLPGNSTEEA